MWSTRRLATHPTLSRPVLGRENDAEFALGFREHRFRRVWVLRLLRYRRLLLPLVRELLVIGPYGPPGAASRAIKADVAGCPEMPKLQHPGP